MTIDKDDKSNVLPKAIRAYSAGLLAPGRSHYAKASKVIDGPVVEFAYNGLTSEDLKYDTSTYPVQGTYEGITPPWLKDIGQVPEDWQWTEKDASDSETRAEQRDAALSYIDENVPGQSYSGTTAEIIQQWYTKGMWNGTVFSEEQIKTLTTHWIADDAEFARQRLGGANPNVIQRASSYNITDWIAKAKNKDALGALKTKLTTAQANNKLFVCDYTAVLGPVVAKQFIVKGRFFAAPICFFTYDNTSKRLMPEAIQIEATDESSYIFTPDDSNDTDGNAWLLAKLWVASADQQWWFSGSHLFNTHSIDMIFGIAALNKIQTGDLKPEHPMVILARPFLVKSFNINNLVISAPASKGEGIYQKGSFCDLVLPTGRIGLYQIITDLYQNYSFDANAFPKQMASRGLEKQDGGIETFPYRDDGLIWWNAIERFVDEIVGATYTKDSEVEADTELNAWLRVAQDAFNHDGNARFTWTPTINGLKSVFTNLLFTCSVQHTAVNDTMFPGWAFTPNGAFAMQAKPPSDATSVNQAAVLASLPNPQNEGQRELIKNQIAFVMNGTAIVSGTLGVSPTYERELHALYPYESGSKQSRAVTNLWHAIWTGSTSVFTQITTNQNARVFSWTGAMPEPNSLAYYYLSPLLTPWEKPGFLNAPVMNAIQI